TSGHLSGFSDPLVDCLNCKERFRADKAPKHPPGTTSTYIKGGKSGGDKISGQVGPLGYVCPVCSSTELSNERQFNLMFRTNLGPVDPMGDVAEAVKDGMTIDQKKSVIDEVTGKSAIYLRPETAQAMFVQFLNVQQSMSMKVPFGIAQVGKSFRNEIVVEHYIFRSCEFEQMEMEFFCEPGTQVEWLTYWKNERIAWYQRYANGKDKFRLRQHDKDELAHYSDDCYDVEYLYPWGWGELEGIASRTNYDLTKHAEASGVKLSYFDQNKPDPVTGKPGWRYVPYVIEPAAGLTRSVLCFLLDAYHEEKGVDHEGQEKVRVVLKLHPKLAPIKAAVLPLVKKDGLPEKAREIVRKFRKAGLNVSYDEQQSIGKRYARHDEIGTPYCLTVDMQTLMDQTVTIRNRDTAQQIRIPIDDAIKSVLDRMNADDFG
ncbi:MAG: glycine--tRNA ligase, partial [Proteobacteria bacterium]|nr:glycine--tRNA ligase [Pseudomonadota bacterium]